MASLLAVLLLSSSPNLGHSLVYAYPPTPCPIARTSRPIYRKANDLSDRRLSGDLSDSSSDSSSSSDDESKSATVYRKSRDHRANAERWGARYVRGEADDVDSEEELELQNTSSIGDLRFSRNNSGPKNSSYAQAQKQRPLSTFGRYLPDYDDTVLASTLLPHREMFDVKFEIVIDALAFIGHPVSLSFLSSATDDSSSEKRGRVVSRNGPSNLVFSRPASRQRPVIPNSIQPSFLEKVAGIDEFYENPATAEGRLERTLSPQSRTLDLAGPSSSRKSSPLPNHESTPQSSSASVTDKSQILNRSSSMLDSFNIVLLVDTPPDQHLSRHLEVYYQDVVVKLAAALKHEECRDGWLSREAMQVIEARDSAIDAGSPYNDFVEQIAEKSPLCQAIKGVFESLKSAKTASFTFNGNTDVSILLHYEKFDNARLDIVDHKALSSYRVSNARNENNTILPATSEALAPWMSLLPLEDLSKILDEAKVAAGLEAGDQLLVKFLEIWTPKLSFKELQKKLSVSDEAFRDLIHRLIKWKKGKIIGVVAAKNIYTPHSRSRRIIARDGQFSTQINTFSYAFPDLPPLPVLLSRLSTPQPFSNFIHNMTMQMQMQRGRSNSRSTVVAPEKNSSSEVEQMRRNRYLQAIIWLLQHELVVQRHLTFRVVINLDSCKAYDTNTNTLKAGMRRLNVRESSSKIASKINSSNNNDDIFHSSSKGGSAANSRRASGTAKQRRGSQRLRPVKSLDGNIFDTTSMLALRRGRRRDSSSEGSSDPRQSLKLTSAFPQSKTAFSGGGEGSSTSATVRESSRTRLSISGGEDRRQSIFRGPDNVFLDDDLSDYGLGVSDDENYDDDDDDEDDDDEEEEDSGDEDDDDDSDDYDDDDYYRDEYDTASGDDLHMSSRKKKKQLPRRRGFHIIKNPAQLTPKDARYLDEMQAGKRPASIKRFNEMLPFLDGTCAIDKIMHEAKISRRDLRFILNDYEDHIISLLL